MKHTEDVDRWQAGVVKLPTVELQTDDGEHENGEEQEKADLKQRDHRLHDGLQHNLQALKYSQRKRYRVQEQSFLSVLPYLLVGFHLELYVK